MSEWLDARKDNAALVEVVRAMARFDGRNNNAHLKQMAKDAIAEYDADQKPEPVAALVNALDWIVSNTDCVKARDRAYAALNERAAIARGPVDK